MTGSEIRPDPFLARRSRYRGALWLAPLALVAALSLARGVTNAVSADWGSTDFHAYWLAGHFLRANRDPYAAFLFARRPAVPVPYLDGTVEAEAVIQPGLGNLPANTAPMTLLLAPLAWWSWPWAKGLWAAINLALALAIPWLALGLLPSRPPPWARWATAFAFWSLVATRVAIGTGQTTLLALTAMLGALRLAWGPEGLRVALAVGGESIGPRASDDPRDPLRPVDSQRERSITLPDWRTLAAGLLLGLAVSKYSLALPAVLLLGWRGRWRILAIALAVQLFAYACMAWLPGGGWKETLNAYLILLQMHLPQEGVHAAAALGGGPRVSLVVGVLLSVVTVGTLWWRGKLGGRPMPQVAARAEGVAPDVGDMKVARARRSVRDPLLLAVLALWTLLVAYHRIYDVTLVVLLLAPALAILAAPDAWQVTRDDRRVLAIFAVPGIALLALAGEGLLAAALPARWATDAADIARITTTRTLLGAWVVSLWLYGRVRPNTPDS
jgi:hypothetical protein